LDKTKIDIGSWMTATGLRLKDLQECSHKIVAETGQNRHLECDLDKFL